MTPLLQQKLDERFMLQALKLARLAENCAEVPVGAVVVSGEEVIGSGYNRCISEHDPCAHAEVLALREAGLNCQNFRLEDATLYVTLEPCLMCCGALLQARIKRLVFGAREPRTGAVVSTHESLRMPSVIHHIAISEGVLCTESAKLLQEFFKSRR